MKSFHDVVTLARVRRLLVASISVLTLGGSAPASAQTAPPVQGTIALQATLKKVYQAANVVIVTTIDGVDHAYHFAKDLVVHGGKKGVDPFEGLREGATVVVHYTVEGTEATVHEIDRIDVEGLETTEGTVTQIDRGRKHITVRYDNGRTETFLLTERASAESQTEEAVAGGKVVIYYSNESGEKVAHFFRKMSKP